MSGWNRSAINRFGFVLGFWRSAVVFVKFVAERADADIENLGGVRAVAVATIQRGENLPFFRFRQRGEFAGGVVVR